MGTPWTEERDAQLRSLAELKYSASQIAVEIGGITRNAVIGRAQRTGVKLQGTNINPEAEARRKARYQRTIENRERRFTVRLRERKSSVDWKALPEPQASPPIVFGAPPPRRLGIGQLHERDCRFPVDEDPILFCGAETLEGTSYCPCHFRLCHRPARG